MLFEKEGEALSLGQFEKLTGAKWIPQLDFESFSLFSKLAKQGLKLHRKGEMTPEQLWLGSYFKKEILLSAPPDIAIRWIDLAMGWGVFALRNFKKMEFIAEYVGKVRKRRRSDLKNGYCFEYLLVQGISSRYTIDALEQGGVARYINHSSAPNLNSCLATFNDLSHVILYANGPIAKGTQLCYDYGPDYWAGRKAPISL